MCACVRVQELEARAAQHAGTATALQQGQHSVARALAQLCRRLHKGTAGLWAAGKTAGSEMDAGAEAEACSSARAGAVTEVKAGDTASAADQQKQQQQQQQTLKQALEQEQLGAKVDEGEDVRSGEGLQAAVHGLDVEVQHALDAGRAVGAALAAVAGGLRAAHAQLQEV